MMKRLMAAALAVLWLSLIPPTVLFAESVPASISVPYYQIWKTDVSGADDRFTYRWTPQTKGAPMPEGKEGSAWDWELKGNTQGKLTLRFSFDAPGTYNYRLAAWVPKPVKGYTYESRTYMLTVLVQDAPGGGLQADWYLLNEKSGSKVDRIDLDPSYTADEKKKDEQDRKKRTDSSASGSRSGRSARTGDDSRIRSWAAILSVSALMLLFLIREDVREWKKRRSRESGKDSNGQNSVRNCR